MKKTNYILLLSVFLIANQNYAQNYTLSFDGTGDYVDVGNSVGNNVRSIELWFKPNSPIDSTLSKPSTLIERNTSSCLGCFGFVFQHTGWEKPGSIRFQNNPAGTRFEVYSDSNKWEEGQWYHIAGVIDPIDGMMLYINGIKQNDTDASTLHTGTFPTITAIGAYGDINDRFFTGQIDEVRIWNRALSQIEIQEKMCEPIDAEQEIGLIGYWRFNEGNGFAAIDHSGNGHDGTIYDANYIIEDYCIATGIKENNPTNSFAIHPNPFDQQATLSFKNEPHEEYSIIIYNSIGQIVGNVENLTGKSYTLKKRSLSAGVYFLQIKIGKTVIGIEKILIK
jgi:Concanavalin A-like lectin/glucanases superfamily/Secretion system C-terminal sorting domain